MRRLLIAMTVLALVACSSDPATTPPPDNGPFTGKSFLRATVGSIAFKCNTGTDTVNEVTPIVSMLKNSNGTFHVVMGGDCFAFQQHISMTIVGDIDTTSNTTYPIGKVVIDPRFNLVIGYTIADPASGTYLPATENAGFLTVDVFDTTRKRIKGTYSATIVKSGGTDSLLVSNGTYEIAY